ncbi:unnamed protein product [Bursaphelenchus xylophilus]|uniref:(pine wood nematode) hypothetical protein n=1 Tax=Bursaphelenchus xylophilus TaxID=6326 RepID=A0A1I7RKB0_BURXY|nr:unnamed protein product [Bursaphelenchus xylophilus]CAG9131396.1 unnamed protein product [Bursaphelenchus xylophilus]
MSNSVLPFDLTKSLIALLCFSQLLSLMAYSIDGHKLRRHSQPILIPKNDQLDPTRQQAQMPRNFNEISRGTMEFIKKTRRVRNQGPQVINMPFHSAGFSSAMRKVLFPTDIFNIPSFTLN